MPDPQLVQIFLYFLYLYSNIKSAGRISSRVNGFDGEEEDMANQDELDFRRTAK